MKKSRTCWPNPHYLPGIYFVGKEKYVTLLFYFPRKHLLNQRVDFDV